MASPLPPRPLEPLRARLSPQEQREVRGLARAVGAHAVLFGLALASVAILLASIFKLGTPAFRGFLLWLDVAIVGFFGAELAWQARRGVRGTTAARRAIAIFGLVPLLALDALEAAPAAAALRPWHVVGALEALVVVARFVRVYDAIFGENAALRLFAKLRAAALEEVSDRVALKILAQVERSVVNARYAEAIGLALDARRVDVARAIVDAMEKTPGFRPVAGFGPAARGVERAAENVATLLSQTLRSSEVNAVVADSLRGIFADLRSEILKKEWRERPIGDPAPPT